MCGSPWSWLLNLCSSHRRSRAVRDTRQRDHAHPSQASPHAKHTHTFLQHHKHAIYAFHIRPQVADLCELLRHREGRTIHDRLIATKRVRREALWLVVVLGYGAKAPKRQSGKVRHTHTRSSSRSLLALARSLRLVVAACSAGVCVCV